MYPMHFLPRFRIQLFLPRSKFVQLVPILARGLSTFCTDKCENSGKQWSKSAALLVSDGGG
jgi:hypothetical protein